LCHAIVTGTSRSDTRRTAVFPSWAVYYAGRGFRIPGRPSEFPEYQRTALARERRNLIERDWEEAGHFAR
jgi:hypothetical protein